MGLERFAVAFDQGEDPSSPSSTSNMRPEFGVHDTAPNDGSWNENSSEGPRLRRHCQIAARSGPSGWTRYRPVYCQTPPLIPKSGWSAGRSRGHRGGPTTCKPAPAVQRSAPGANGGPGLANLEKFLDDDTAFPGREWWQPSGSAHRARPLPRLAPVRVRMTRISQVRTRARKEGSHGGASGQDVEEWEDHEPDQIGGVPIAGEGHHAPMVVGRVGAGGEAGDNQAIPSSPQLHAREDRT